MPLMGTRRTSSLIQTRQKSVKRVRGSSRVPVDPRHPGRASISRRQSTGAGCDPNGRCITMESTPGQPPETQEQPCNDNCGCDHLDNVVGNTCETTSPTGVR